MPLFYDILPPQTVLCICFLLHVIADFNLQGMLGDLKQREWWQKNYPDPKYAGDYRVAGTIHALAWAILTFLPFCQSPWYALAVAVNAPIHYFVDDAKANRHLISLCEDQTIHSMQIVCTVGFIFAVKILTH